MPAERFPRKFFLRPVTEVAPELIGAKLCTRRGKAVTTAMIVEAEAYDGEVDEAAHCFGGRTPRTAVMFGEGGHAYVYFIYGMHYCMNVVADRAGHGAGVLLRAAEPLDGLALMQKRRKTDRLIELSNGPGKLCQALGIDGGMNGADLVGSENIWLERYRTPARREIACSRRIGIQRSVELPWRWYLAGSAWVGKTGR